MHCYIINCCFLVNDYCKEHKLETKPVNVIDHRYYIP